MIYLELFFRFFCTGLFSVGGGLATIPFLQDIGASTGWYTTAELVNMIAVAESTPGPIGVNMATYVGYTVGGLPGALVATAGLAAPSVIIIILIASLLKKFRESRAVQGVLFGLRPASIGLISSAGLEVAVLVFFSGTVTISTVNWLCVGLTVALFILMKLPRLKKLHPIIFILASALAGILLKL